MVLDGYKFDLRLYVLVTSFHPLEAFVYGDGFARVSTQVGWSRLCMDVYGATQTLTLTTVHCTRAQP